MDYRICDEFCNEITLEKIARDVERSNYNTKGIKVIVPAFLGIFSLLWIALIWNQPFWAIVTTSVCLGPLLALVIYAAVVTSGVSSSIMNGVFFIEKVVVVGKRFRPGNAEDLPVFTVIFEKYGKFYLTGKSDPDAVQTGDEYYVLLCGKSKKIRFIYNAEKWQISEIDFIEENGIYYPIKRRS